MLTQTTSIFEQLESNVRSYCRAFPDVFIKGKNSAMYTKSGAKFIDFFAGAGALNYGHNNDFIKKKLIAYLETDGLAHGLDMHTSAKENFLQTFNDLILRPRNLEYKVMFCGPTGANAVEAGLKIARKTKQRSGIFAFTGGFHGMSLGALSVTANSYNRQAAGVDLPQVTFMPYPTDFSFDTIEYIDKMISDSHSGIAKPAAIICETIQAEGGINVAPIQWLQRLRQLCDKHDVLLICDEVQIGCGRAGSFFSFERAPIVPDIVVLSKSISGYGLPMSLLLFKPELDIWQPAEHNGTFRGNQLAFVAAEAALHYREMEQLEAEVLRKEKFVKQFLNEHIASLHDQIDVRGMGLIWGVDVAKVSGSGVNVAKKVAKRCYERGLIIECVGRNDTVIKLLPPLTIEWNELQKGCDILQQSMRECLSSL
ncbi:diaminobutyrate--2-oxoglutarate transaminase [Brevibacillus laterosporus]|uniref:Diaminobutyrate--2-oxoglutarate transaminase n=1 Tax=Brevibacillus laterosporus TaxID=1465 RepID=A0AAP8QCA2_BRELA|nr:diaminobutyrate--2-oxoglutarate transaminase [Brevibacillus laterosporus]MBG9798760.1 diadenosine tetraphosphatase [Brevibacillus laterosporus]MCR8936049.1 diaminobutyrate--2-oxoglutarate transaminase [Brevibacillus laterosporus]MCZ0838688.1 diaminobutyrate--2-oxoglutarate transaminase [Brevibacillus laterosporus]MCZ0843153.1 diaminobutyrate--2-oxoglutarate transaminase [Brevibacillus laterosporus]MED1665984.1 diaminobutyrate--2-oxoglutarate transaminase [Brevibacillus laterosporus]